jgi:hypothetical protein
MLDGRQCGILYFSKRYIHEMEVPLLISTILCTILSIVVCGDTICKQSSQNTFRLIIFLT